MGETKMILKPGTIVRTDIEKYGDQQFVIKGHDIDNGRIWYYIENPSEGNHKVRHDRIIVIPEMKKFLVAYQRLPGTTVINHLIDALEHREVVDLLNELSPNHSVIILAIIEIHPT
jgi:hypothetical protein